MKTKRFGVFFLVLLLVTGGAGAFVIAAATVVYAEDSACPQKTLSFLSDVLSIDVPKYNATLLNDAGNVSYPTAVDGGNEEESVRYNLQTNESVLIVTCTFKKAILHGAPSIRRKVPQSISRRRLPVS
jgi:hypothetical protein